MEEYGLEGCYDPNCPSCNPAAKQKGYMLPEDEEAEPTDEEIASSNLTEEELEVEHQIFQEKIFEALKKAGAREIEIKEFIA